MIGYLYLHVVGQANCGAIMLVAQIGYITSVGAACFLLALRVANMMWSNDKSVTIWLALLGSATVACRVCVFTLGFVFSCLFNLMPLRQAAVASQSGVSQVPQIPFTSNCILRPFVSWIAVEHASVLAFDVFCLVFALGKLGDQRRSPSFEMLHYRRCVPYYVAATLGNAGMLVIQLLSSDYDHVKAAAIPFSILISVATARFAFFTSSHVRTRAKAFLIVESHLIPALSANSGNILRTRSKDLPCPNLVSLARASEWAKPQIFHPSSQCHP